MIACDNCGSMSCMQQRSVFVRRHTECALSGPSGQVKPSRAEKRALHNCTGIRYPSMAVKRRRCLSQLLIS
eukprot:6483706-Amphidinium_carterae.1